MAERNIFLTIIGEIKDLSDREINRIESMKQGVLSSSDRGIDRDCNTVSA